MNVLYPNYIVVLDICNEYILFNDKVLILYRFTMVNAAFRAKNVSPNLNFIVIVKPLLKGIPSIKKRIFQPVKHSN